MRVRAGATEEAISFRNLGEMKEADKVSFVWILAKQQFLNSIYLVQSSLVTVLINCSFKISTWSVGSE